jgi:hypothetical protein
MTSTAGLMEPISIENLPELPAFIDTPPAIVEPIKPSLEEEAKLKAEAAIAAAANLKENSIVLDLTFKRPGITAGVDAELIDSGNTNKQFLRMGKYILKSTEYNAVVAKESAVRATIKSYSIPDKSLRSGLYRLPIKLAEKAYEYLVAQLAERETLIEVFMTAYPQLIVDAESDLGDQYDIDDYPLSYKMRAAFDSSFAFKTDDTPASLKKISASIFAHESKKANLKIANEIEDIQKALRIQLLEMVEKVKEAFEPGDDTKKKRFSPKSCEKLKEFCALVKERNLTGDIEIDKIADSVNALLSGVDPKTIKGSPKADKILEELQATTAELHTLTEAVPVRKFMLS